MVVECRRIARVKRAIRRQLKSRGDAGFSLDEAKSNGLFRWRFESRELASKGVLHAAQLRGVARCKIHAFDGILREVAEPGWAEPILWGSDLSPAIDDGAEFAALDEIPRLVAVPKQRCILRARRLVQNPAAIRDGYALTKHAGDGVGASHGARVFDDRQQIHAV